jgi:integrase
MNGSVRKKGSVWYYRYYEYVNGEKKQIEKKGGSTKSEALKKLNEAIYKMNNGYVNPSDMQLKEYLTMWLDDYVKDEKSFGTYDRYKTICEKHINPCIGNVKLSDLKVMDIEKYIRNLKQTKITRNSKELPLSATTVQGAYGVLRTALNKAVKLQLINDTPCRFIDTPKRSKFKANILTVDEFKSIYDSLDINKYDDYIMQLALKITLETGLRRGEMCGLTWDDIDLGNKILKVNQSLIRNGNDYILSTLKTESSYRKIPISDELINRFKKHKKIQKQNLLKYGESYTKTSFNKSLVITWENGKYIIPSNFLQRFKRLCKYNNITKNIRWHDLRHTNATLLLEGGVTMKVVQERLGHSLMQTTSDIYAHVTENMNREATNVISSALKIK